MTTQNYLHIGKAAIKSFMVTSSIFGIFFVLFSIGALITKPVIDVLAIFMILTFAFTLVIASIGDRLRSNILIAVLAIISVLLTYWKFT